MKKPTKYKNQSKRHRRPRWARHAYTYAIKFQRKISLQYAQEEIKKLDVQRQQVYKQQTRFLRWDMPSIIYIVIALWILIRVYVELPNRWNTVWLIAGSIAGLVLLWIYHTRRDKKLTFFNHELQKNHFRRKDMYHLLQKT